MLSRVFKGSALSSVTQQERHPLHSSSADKTSLTEAAGCLNSHRQPVNYPRAERRPKTCSLRPPSAFRRRGRRSRPGPKVNTTARSPYRGTRKRTGGKNAAAANRDCLAAPRAGPAPSRGSAQKVFEKRDSICTFYSRLWSREWRARPF